MIAQILIFRMKRPEIDEICCNSSYIGVNECELCKTQTSKLCNTIILRKDEVCPSKISHKLYKQSLFILLQNVRPILIVSDLLVICLSNLIAKLQDFMIIKTTYKHLGRQSFIYVFPSVPQTGSKFPGQSQLPPLQGQLPLHLTVTPL